MTYYLQGYTDCQKQYPLEYQETGALNVASRGCDQRGNECGSPRRQTAIDSALAFHLQSKKGKTNLIFRLKGQSHYSDNKNDNDAKRMHSLG